MISKEELERLYDDYEYLMQEYYKCPIIGLKEEQIIQTKENVNHIKQDLDRLEQLEDNIKIHKETIKMQHNQIESLQSKNKELKEGYEITSQLNRNQYTILEELNEKNLRLEQENIKLKKVIEILKSKGVQESFLKNTKNVNEYNKAIKYLNYFDELTPEEYDLLKEYLDDK